MLHFLLYCKLAGKPEPLEHISYDLPCFVLDTFAAPARHRATGRLLLSPEANTPTVSRVSYDVSAHRLVSTDIVPAYLRGWWSHAVAPISVQSPCM